MLIHSAQPIGGVSSRQSVSPPPSWQQGFGRLQLDQVFALPDSPFALRVIEGTLTHSDEYVKHCFKIDRQHHWPQVATLVWNDPVGALEVAIELVNDLDLTLFRRYYNGHEWIDEHVVREGDQPFFFFLSFFKQIGNDARQLNYPPTDQAPTENDLPPYQKQTQVDQLNNVEKALMKPLDSPAQQYHDDRS